MNFHDDLKVSPYSSIAFWVRYLFSFTEILHLQSIINGKSWKHFRLKVRQITWRRPPEWRSWRKKKWELVICSSAHWLKLRCIKIYCHFLGKYCNGYKKILEKNFRWRKCLVLMAEKFSSYPLPETAKEWIIPLIKQSKLPPLFWVFMFVFQVTIDQYQACQCGWFT